MKKVKDSEENKTVETSQEVETSSEETPVQEAEKLSLRDALEVAIEGTKEPEKDAVGKPVDRDAARAVSTDDKGKPEPKPVKEDTKAGEEPLQPPGEYTPEEKADFLQLSRKGQEAQLRLDRSRKTRIEEIRRESAELQWSKDLVKELTPYLKSVGEKRPTHEALVMALKMRNEFENAKDPKAAAAAYLKAKGIEPPKELLETNPQKNLIEEQITPLQQEVSMLKMRLAQEDQARATGVLSQAWQTFEEQKNAAGKPKFPDADNSPAGITLAGNIGSLVRGDTALSQQFISNVRSRIPGVDYLGLLIEAYKYCGGRVDDSSNDSRTQITHKQIVKSSRAASSVPGRGSPSTISGPAKKLPLREALAAAVAELRESEGA